MKKIFLSAAVIAFTFVAFAFKPMAKNNSIDNPLTAATVMSASTCTEYYETSFAFSKCYKTTTTEAEVEATEDAVLGGL
jgi:hypothetical protein